MLPSAKAATAMARGAGRLGLAAVVALGAAALLHGCGEEPKGLRGADWLDDPFFKGRGQLIDGGGQAVGVASSTTTAWPALPSSPDGLPGNQQGSVDPFWPFSDPDAAPQHSRDGFPKFPKPDIFNPSRRRDKESQEPFDKEEDYVKFVIAVSYKNGTATFTLKPSRVEFTPVPLKEKYVEVWKESLPSRFPPKKMNDKWTAAGYTADTRTVKEQWEKLDKQMRKAKDPTRTPASEGVDNFSKMLEGLKDFGKDFQGN